MTETQKDNNVSELKKKISILVIECFNRSKEKKFSDLNYRFREGKSELAQLKAKLKVFENLDEYSQTFLSIHTRAKIALRDLKIGKHAEHCSELVRLILTLPDGLGTGKLKSSAVRDKEVIVEIEKQIEDKEKEIAIEEKKKPVKKLKRSGLLKQGKKGKTLFKEKIRNKQIKQDLEEIDFEDNE